MTIRSRPRWWLAPGFTALVLVAVDGCNDSTGPGQIPLNLETIWPNEDGRVWLYRAAGTFREPDLTDPEYVFTDSSLVPPAPDIVTVGPLLDAALDTTGSEIVDTSYRLRFEGTTVTQSGVAGQNLVEEVEATDLSPGLRSASARLLVRIARARPDLRERLAAAAPGVFEGAAYDPIDAAPLLLHGGAWERTPDHIGTYGDLDTLLAWKYLDPGLVPGHRFTHTLLPSIVSNIVLHVWVRRVVTVDTPVGAFAGALEVVYLLDYGILEYTTVFRPDPVGYSRQVLYGRVIYVPTVGPVSAEERDLVPVGADGLGRGIGSRKLSLSGVRSGTL